MISALVMAATITGGTLGPFTGNADWIAKNAVSAKTPGGDDWYEKVESIKVPDKWAIYRNGVLTNCPPPHLVADTSSRYLKHFELDGCVTDEEHEYFYPTYWFPLFNCGPSEVSWSSHYFGEDEDYDCYYKAEATNVTDTSVAALDIWLPKTLRLDGDSFASVIASYEAYYERLYSGSAGERSVWNVNDWGPRQPGQAFAFNLTNSFASFDQYLPDPATNRLFWSHLLKEGRNINNLYRCVMEMFPTECKTEWWDLHRGHPIDDALRSKSFIYRPGWALAHDGPSWIWWATSAKIPGLEHERLLPDVPEWTPVSMLDSMSNSFSKCATTLDMLAPADAFHTKGGEASFPIWKMLENSTFSYDPIKDFSFKTQCTMYDVITNNFPNCCKGYARSPEWPDTGMWDYQARVWEYMYDNDYRIKTGRLEGVNQVLSLMDRTIMIPDFRQHVEMKQTRYQKNASYSTTNVYLKVIREGDNLVLDEESLEMTIGKSEETNIVEQTSWDGDHPYVETYSLGTGILKRINDSDFLEKAFYLSQEVIPESDMTFGDQHKMDLLSIGASGGPIGLSLTFNWRCNDDDANHGRLFPVTILVPPADGNGSEVKVSFDVNVTRAYWARRPTKFEVFLQQGILPYDSEKADSTLGIFSWRAYDYEAGFPDLFKCKTYPYANRLNISNRLVDVGNEYWGEMRNWTNGKIGVNDFEDIEEMIPVPDAIHVGKLFSKEVRLSTQEFENYYQDCYFDLEFALFSSGIVAHFYITYPNGQRLEFDYEHHPLGLCSFKFEPLGGATTSDMSDFEPDRTNTIISTNYKIITQQDWNFKNMKRGTTK